MKKADDNTELLEILEEIIKRLRDQGVEWKDLNKEELWRIVAFNILGKGMEKNLEDGTLNINLGFGGDEDYKKLEDAGLMEEATLRKSLGIRPREKLYDINDRVLKDLEVIKDVELYNLLEMDSLALAQKKPNIPFNFISNIGNHARTDLRILIVGETGTGKELLAKAIHRMSKRSNKPYEMVNCAAIPEKLLESELFGYEKGAYSEAYKSKKGLLELANGGTFFFDELGKMPVPLQAKILRVVEDLEIPKLGKEGRIKVNIRFLAAAQPIDIKSTNILDELKWRFGYPDIIEMPTLNESLKGKSSLIIHTTFKTVKEKLVDIGMEGMSINTKAVQILAQHYYKGNYRELEGILRKAAFSSINQGRKVILPEDLDFILKDGNTNQISAPPSSEDLKDIKLSEIFDYCKNKTVTIVNKKIKEIIESGLSIKNVIVSKERKTEQYYQHFLKQLKSITGKGINEFKNGIDQIIS